MQRRLKQQSKHLAGKLGAHHFMMSRVHSRFLSSSIVISYSFKASFIMSTPLVYIITRSQPTLLFEYIDDNYPSHLLTMAFSGQLLTGLFRFRGGMASGGSLADTFAPLLPCVITAWFSPFGVFPWDVLKMRGNGARVLS